MRFSIIFPTRERPYLLKQILDSIQNMTADLAEIECLIAVDSDDWITSDFLSKNQYSFLKTFKVQRSLNFSRDYYNYLAKQSSGQWIFIANDDAAFETKDWDVIAYDILKNKSNIIYGWVDDGIGEFRVKGHGEYTCFPVIGRKAFETMGFIFPDRIPIWGADIWCRKIYDQIQSTVKLPIKINHYTSHNNTRPQDEIHKRIQNNQVPYDIRPSYDEVNKLLVALKEERDVNQKVSV